MIRTPSLLIVSFVASLVGAACGGDSDSDPVVTPDATPVDPTEAVFDPAHLLVVEIDIAPEDWDALRFEHHDFLTALGPDCQSSPPPKPYNYYPATVTVDGEQVANVGIRKKGFLGSVTPQRPSLKVKFDELVPDQKWSGLRRLTLNNNHQDDSRLNTCMTYSVFRAAGSPAPRCNHARVIVNGQDLGIYSNVEAVKRPMLRRWFDDDNGNLYEGVASDFRDGWTDTFEHKGDELQPDRSDLSAVAPILAMDDALVVDALDQVIDVDAFLTFWAAEVLVDHWDGYAGNVNNFYVYHDPTSDKFRFVPWGPDASFGVINPFPPVDRPASVHAVSALPRRLYRLPETQSRYRERMQTVLDGAWDETALAAKVDRTVALIRPHLIIDEGRFDADVGRVRDFIASRRGAVQAELDAAAPAWDHSLRGNPCLSKIGEVTGSFDTTRSDPFPPALPIGVGAGEITATFGGVDRPLANPGYTAGVGDQAGGIRDSVMVLALEAGTNSGFGVLLGVEPELYGVGEFPVDMYTTFAVALDGPLGPDMALAGFLSGTLEFTAAGTAPGEAVTGSFAVDVWGSPPEP